MPAVGTSLACEVSVVMAARCSFIIDGGDERVSA